MNYYDYYLPMYSKKALSRGADIKSVRSGIANLRLRTSAIDMIYKESKYSSLLVEQMNPDEYDLLVDTAGLPAVVRLMAIYALERDILDGVKNGL